MKAPRSFLSLAGHFVVMAFLASTDGAEIDYAAARARMVAQQLASPERGITNRRVLRAMGEVPRHEFVPADLRRLAYTVRPLPIGHDQTISQPYIVAFMIEQLARKPTDRVMGQSGMALIPNCFHDEPESLGLFIAGGVARQSPIAGG